MNPTATVTSACPACGTESDRILTEFDRIFPLPAVHLVRYQCVKRGCGAIPRDKRKRTAWDVPTKRKLEKLPDVRPTQW